MNPNVAPNSIGTISARPVTSWLDLIDPAKLYTVQELAARSTLHSDTIRGLFINEPGVLTISNHRRGVRDYKTLRIPGHIAIAVFKRMTNGGSR